MWGNDEGVLRMHVIGMRMNVCINVSENFVNNEKYFIFIFLNMYLIFKIFCCRKYIWPGVCMKYFSSFIHIKGI